MINLTHSFRDQVIGTWSLLEYTREDDFGERYYPFGKDAVGYLMYTPDGYMSAQLMAIGRKPYSLNQLHTGTKDEMAAAAHGYHAYSGKFDVDEDTQTLYHHMEVSMIPNRLGMIQDRKIEITGDEITITSDSTSSFIRWKKAKTNNPK